MAAQNAAALSRCCWPKAGEQAFVQLERQDVNVAPTIVTHVAPLGWEHIGLTGDYVWSDGEQPPKDAFRPLRRRESMLAA
jgi:hypothetical protein